jgi:hypothetical protein
MDDPDPIAVWWRSLTPEVQRVWIYQVTGWTIQGAIAEAYKRANGEKPGETPADGG